MDIQWVVLRNRSLDVESECKKKFSQGIFKISNFIIEQVSNKQAPYEKLFKKIHSFQQAQGFVFEQTFTIINNNEILLILTSEKLKPSTWLTLSLCLLEKLLQWLIDYEICEIMD